MYQYTCISPSRYCDMVFFILIYIIAPLLLSYSAVAQDSVSFVYTNNTNGYIEACDCGEEPLGGLARRKFIFDNIRKNERAVIFVDAGDFLNQFGFSPQQDSMTIRLYELLSYDAVNPGDNEFANGYDFFERIVSRSKLPFTSSTLWHDNRPIAQPYQIVTRENYKIGIIGYTPYSAFRYFPKNKQPGVHSANERERLNAAIKDIRSRVDILMVLSHAGSEEDKLILSDFPDIDMIVGAHDQVEIEEPIVDKNRYIVQAGGNGTKVGKLTLYLKSGKMINHTNRFYTLSENITEDAEIKKLITRFKKANKK